MVFIILSQNQLRQMMKTIFFSLVCLSASLITQAQDKAGFIRFVKAYQLREAQKYIKTSGGMLPDTTRPQSLITNEILELEGGSAPEYLATFHLGSKPYRYQVVMIQYVDDQKRKVYFTYQYLDNYGEPFKPVYYRDFRIIDGNFRDIKSRVLPPTTWDEIRVNYQTNLKKCDNYKGAMVPINYSVLPTLKFTYGRGGSYKNRKTTITLGLNYQSKNSICAIYMGELSFDKVKGVFKFKKS